MMPPKNLAQLPTVARCAEMLARKGVTPYLRKMSSYMRSPRISLRHDLDVASDLRAFRSANIELLSGSRPVPRKRVLVVSLSTLFYQLKLEIVLARALSLRGYEPYFLTYRSVWVPNYPRMYLGSARFGHMLYFEDYLPPTLDAIDAIDASAVGTAWEAGQLRSFEYRGVKVGQHVLSALSRNFRRGRIDPTEPRAAEFVRRTLPDALRNVAGAERLLDHLRPDLVLFNDRGYAHYGPIHDVAMARWIDTLQFNWALEDSALILKRYTAETSRIHPNSLSEESWRAARTMPWTELRQRELQQYFEAMYRGRWYMSARNQHRKCIKTRAEVQAQLGLDSAKKTVTVFSHVLWDSNLWYGEDLFEDFGEWLVETMRVAYHTPSVNWVLKLHPINSWKKKKEGWESDADDELDLLRSRLGPLPPHVRIVDSDTDINTFSFFHVADAAVTVRGTIGAELPCFGVPVLTAGTGRYSGLGFTVDSTCRSEYLDRLRRIETLEACTPAQRELAQRYAYALFLMRPWRFRALESSYMPLELANHPLSWNVFVRSRTLKEFAESPDIQTFSDWAGDSSQLDFLGPFGAE
jgi:hypothetical protein